MWNYFSQRHKCEFLDSARRKVRGRYYYKKLSEPWTASRGEKGYIPSLLYCIHVHPSLLLFLAFQSPPIRDRSRDARKTCEKKLGNDLSSHAWKRPFMITAASDHLSALTAVETFDSLFLHRVHCANTNKDAQLSVPEQLCFLSV